MLFARSKKRKTFAVPKITRQAIEDIVEKVTQENAPAKALSRIKKTKAYIQARLDGSNKKEAKALANYTGDEKALLTSPVGQSILASLLEQDFSDRIITERLKEMWNEGDVILDKKGQIVHERKNHKVRQFAFEQVVKLRGYAKADDKGNDNAVPTQIVFNVQTPPPVPKSMIDGPIEVQAEEAK
jgi:hypothetical protein